MHTNSTTDFERELLDCIKTKAQASSYTNRLGFRRRSPNPNSNRGRPSFEGKVGKFYSATGIVVDKSVTKYDSCKDLEDAICGEPAETPGSVIGNRRKTTNPYGGFKDDDIEACLKKWGPHVWNNSRTGQFEIVLDKENNNYPDYLIYENREHRKKIRTLVYCSIIHRAYVKIKQKPAEKTTSARVKPQVDYKDATPKRSYSFFYWFGVFTTAVIAIAIVVVFVSTKLTFVLQDALKSEWDSFVLVWPTTQQAWENPVEHSATARGQTM